MKAHIRVFFVKARRAVLHWLKQNFIVISQGINTLFFGGFADETFCARSWRLRNTYRFWALTCRAIDGVTRKIDPNHCEESYKSEMERTQSPEEYRPGAVAEK